MPWAIFMILGRTSLWATRILVLGYHGDNSLATVARGQNFAINYTIYAFTSDFVAHTQVKLAYM